MFFGQEGAGQKGPQDGQPPNTTEFYEMLDITRQATTEQIKKAFRKKALKEHPDRGGDPERFRRIKEASETLIDPEKRQLYDDYGEEGVKNGGPPGMGGGNMFDFFNNKQKDNRPKKMKPKLVPVEITLEEVYKGIMKQVTVTRHRVCVGCEGKGGSNPVSCEDCKGVGVALKMVQLGPGIVTQAQVKCDKCEGRGEVVKEEDRCKVCQGKRVKEEEKVIQVPIDQGVPDSHDYIMYGEADQLPGVMAGDVYVRISIKKHESFERRGADLVFSKEVTLLQALTGVTTTVKHLSGKEYLVATAPGEVLENKELKTLRGLGLPFYKDSMSSGNLYFEFIVTFPEANSLGKDQEKAIREAFLFSETNEGLEGKEGAAVLGDYSEQKLNPSCRKNPEQEEEEEDGEGQGVQCQGQ